MAHEWVNQECRRTYAYCLGVAFEISYHVESATALQLQYSVSGNEKWNTSLCSMLDLQFRTLLPRG